MNADLHYHGPINFQYAGLSRQGYAGKNILKEVTDSCIRNGIDICAMVSKSSGDFVKKGSVDDRFGYLMAETERLAEGYLPIRLGNNVLAMKKEDKTVYIINAQSVFAYENGRVVESIVIGTNEARNKRPIKELLRDTWFRDDRINIAEHPFSLDHGGLGEGNLNRYLNYYDAIEGHNAQFILPGFLGGILRVGDYTKKVNAKAKEYALKMQKPWVATSDGHRIEDVGISHIQLEGVFADSEKTLLKTLKEAIRKNRFTPVCRYPALGDWLNWAIKSKLGI